MRRPTCLPVLLSALVALAACSDDDDGMTVRESASGRTFFIPATENATSDALLAFLEAGPGDLIEFDCGYFELGTALVLQSTEDVTIRGCGMNETVLSFRDSDSPEGILAINVNGLRIEDLTVVDSPGDGVRLTAGRHVTLTNVRAHVVGGLPDRHRRQLPRVRGRPLYRSSRVRRGEREPPGVQPATRHRPLRDLPGPVRGRGPRRRRGDRSLGRRDLRGPDQPLDRAQQPRSLQRDGLRDREHPGWRVHRQRRRVQHGRVPGLRPPQPQPVRRHHPGPRQHRRQQQHLQLHHPGRVHRRRPPGQRPPPPRLRPDRGLRQRLREPRHGEHHHRELRPPRRGERQQARPLRRGDLDPRQRLPERGRSPTVPQLGAGPGRGHRHAPPGRDRAQEPGGRCPHRLRRDRRHPVRLSLPDRRRRAAGSRRREGQADVHGRGPQPRLPLQPVQVRARVGRAHPARLGSLHRRHQRLRAGGGRPERGADPRPSSTSGGSTVSSS